MKNLKQILSKFKDVCSDEIEVISIRENERKGSKSNHSIQIQTYDCEYYFDSEMNFKASKRFHL